MRITSLSGVFVAMLVATLVLLGVALYSPCQGDAAGCGMQAGFVGLIVLAAGSFTLLLGALFLIPKRAVRIAALVMLAPVFVGALLNLLFSL